MLKKTRIMVNYNFSKVPVIDIIIVVLPRDIIERQVATIDDWWGTRNFMRPEDHYMRTVHRKEPNNIKMNCKGLQSTIKMGIIAIRSTLLWWSRSNSRLVEYLFKLQFVRVSGIKWRKARPINYIGLCNSDKKADWIEGGLSKDRTLTNFPYAFLNVNGESQQKTCVIRNMKSLGQVKLTWPSERAPRYWKSFRNVNNMVAVSQSSPCRGCWQCIRSRKTGNPRKGRRRNHEYTAFLAGKNQAGRTA